MRRISLLILGLSLLGGPAAAQIYDDFNSINTNVFHKADGWTNGAPFDCTWRADCVSFAGGSMSLTIDNDTGSLPYKAGEYRTNTNVSYGLFEISMQASKALGTTSTFFTYTGPSEDNPWDEIDIEIIWRDSDGSLSEHGIMQTNYFTDGTGGHETRVELPFDASAAFHTYAFEWLPDSIKWYVDGELVVTEDGSRGPLPSTPSKIMMNHWPGSDVDQWLGAFDGQVPRTARYDWIRYTPAGTGPPTSPPALLGDVNGDSAVTIIDALMTAQDYVGLDPPGFDPAQADVNCNGTRDIVDALMIAQFYVGLINQFCQAAGVREDNSDRITGLKRM